jgi:ribosomal protein S18 acetylase RimI-like enzyme
MSAVAEQVLTPLPWDSSHFGFPVAKIITPRLDDWALSQVLAEARRQEIRLVYWPAPSYRQVSTSLLMRFSGVLADRKAIFTAHLPAPSLPSSAWEPDGERQCGSQAALGNQDVNSSWRIGEYPKTPPTRQLLDLAIAAGVYSRFACDPRIPKNKFVQLYERWMQGSTLGEMADQVLVACGTDPLSDCLGMISYSIVEAGARIGLIAVRDQARGKGIGSALIAAAHREMAKRGARMATVCTQCANVPACRLYDEVQNVYHFWIDPA